MKVGWAAATGFGAIFGASALTVTAWLFGEPRETVDHQEFPIAWLPPGTAMIVAWVFIPLWSAAVGFLFRRHRGRPSDGPGASARLVNLLGFLWFAVFVALVASLKLIFADGTYWGELVRVTLGTLVVAAAVGAVLERTGFTPRRPTVPTALLLTFGYLGAAVCAALLVALSRTSTPGSYTGNQRGLTVVATVAVMVGSVLVAVGRNRPARLPSVAAALLLAVGLVVVAAPAVAVGVRNTDAAHVDATTAAAVPPAALPTSRAKRKWSWRSTEDVLAVQAAGAGVVVATESGIVALDGVSGTERWHYRRDDALITVHADRSTSDDYEDLGNHGLFVLDHGRTVVAAFGRMYQAFDAFTGQELWRDYKISSAVASYEPQAAETTLISVDGTVDGAGDWHSESFVAQDSRTGATAWRWTAPQGCGRPEETLANMEFLTIDDVVFLPTLCDQDGPGMVALDARTGKELWRHEAPPDDRFSVRVKPFGDAVAVRDSSTTGDALPLFQARTGQPLGSVRGDFAGADPDSDAVFYVTESGGTLFEPGRDARWTYDGARGSLIASADGEHETAFLRDSVAVYTRDHDRLLLLSLDTGATLREISAPQYQYPADPPWVIAAPGALVLADLDRDGHSRLELTGLG